MAVGVNAVLARGALLGTLSGLLALVGGPIAVAQPAPSRLAASDHAARTGQPAIAAARWSAPVTLARGSGGASFGASALFAPGGAGAIAWRTTIMTLSATGAPGRRRSAATRARGFGGLLATYGSAHVVSLPQAGAVAVDTSLAGDALATTRLGVPAGSLLALAANRAGTVALLSESCSACAQAQPLLAVRPSGAARFATPRELLPARLLPRSRRGGPTVASVSVAPDGTVLAAWVQQTQGAGGAALSDVVYARLLQPGGQLSPAVRLGGGSQFDPNAALAGAFGAHDEPVVAFEGDGEGCEAPGAVTVHAAVGDARGRFAHAQLLGSFPSIPLDGYCLDSWGPRYPSAVLGVVDDPQPLVVWTGAAAGHLAVRAANLLQGRFGAAVTVSRPDGEDNVLAALAASPGTGATALWVAFPRGVGALGGSERTTVLAAAATSSDAFGRPAVVAPSSGVCFPLSLAVNPVGGRAVATWTSFQPGGSTRLDYAVRPARR